MHNPTPTVQIATTFGSGILTASAYRCRPSVCFVPSRAEHERRAMATGAGTLAATASVYTIGITGRGELHASAQPPPFVVVSWVATGPYKNHRGRTRGIDDTRTVMSPRLNYADALIESDAAELLPGVVKVMIIDTRICGTHRASDAAAGIEAMISGLRIEQRRGQAERQRTAKRAENGYDEVENRANLQARPAYLSHPGGVYRGGQYSSTRWPDPADQPTFSWDVQLEKLRTLLATLYAPPVPVLGTTAGCGQLSISVSFSVSATAELSGAGSLSATAAATKLKDCKAPGCPRTAETGGYCSLHYNRLHRYGDVGPPEAMQRGQRLTPPDPDDARCSGGPEWAFALVFWTPASYVAEFRCKSTLVACEDLQDELPQGTRSVILSAEHIAATKRKRRFQITDALVERGRADRAAQPESVTSDLRVDRIKRSPNPRGTSGEWRKLEDRLPIPR